MGIQDRDWYKEESQKKARMRERENARAWDSQPAKQPRKNAPKSTLKATNPLTWLLVLAAFAAGFVLGEARQRQVTSYGATSLERIIR